MSSSRATVGGVIEIIVYDSVNDEEKKRPFLFFSARPQAGDQEANDSSHNEVKKKEIDNNERKLI